jgi:hypothetical protein
MTTATHNAHGTPPERVLWRDFGTTYDQLLALRAWIDKQRCPIVVLESTGV